MDALTLLRPADGSLPGKTVTPAGPSTPAPAKYWRGLEVPIPDQAKLFQTLERAALSRQVIAVRGAIAPGVDRQQMRRSHVNEPTLVETPRQWLLVDLDKHRPDHQGGSVQEWAELALADLGFTGVACWAQATSSARVKPGLRLRLAFWLDRPISNAEAKAWVKSWSVPADLSLYTPSQPHFLGAPQYLDGAEDPYQGEPRSVTLPGTELRVVLDPSSQLKAHDELQTEVRKLKRAQEGERRNQLNASAFRLASRFAEDELPAQRIIEALEGALPPENLGYKASLTLRQAIDDGRAKHAQEREGWRSLLARDADGNPKSTAANVSLYLECHPAFQNRLAFDERAQKPVWLLPPPWPDRGPSADVTHAVEWFQTQARIDARPSWVRDGLLKAALARPFDPVQSWLEALPEWDGQPRVQTLLVRHLGVEDTELHREQTQAWLVQAYLRAFATLDSPVQADYVLVLMGEQGLRKSSFLRALCPLPRFFRDALPSLSDKDASLAVIDSWLIELSELTQRKADQDQFKAFLARRTEKFRPPYQAYEVQAPRRCVIAATTNDLEPLVDPTGNRRFWPMIVTRRADLSEVELERAQLWAEVKHLAEAGARPYLSDALERQANLVQAQFAEEDPVQARLEAALRRPVEFTSVSAKFPNGWPSKLRAIEAADLVNEKRLRAVKHALVRLGWREMREGARREWVPPEGWLEQEQEEQWN